MNKYKTLYTNTLIFFVSEFASRFLVFLLLPLYTRYLTKEQYGIVDLIATTVNLLLPVFTLCISQAALRFAMDNSSDKKQVFSLGVKVIILGFLLLLALYPLITRVTSIEPYLMLFYLLYFTSAVDGFFSQFVRAVNKVGLVGVTGVVKTAVMIGANLILLILFRMGITGYVLSAVLSYTASILILFLGGKLYSFCTVQRADKIHVGAMLRYSIPLMPNSLSWWLINFAGRYIILFYCGVGVQGLFAAATKIPVILATVQSIFINAWQLSAISEYDKPNRDEFYSNIYKLYNIGMILCASILIVLVRVIARLLFAGEYYGAWIYVPLLLISVVFGAMSGYLSTFFAASKQTKTMFSTTLMGGLAAVLLNFMLVPYFGAIGTAVAAVLANIVVWAILLNKSREYVTLDIDIVHSCICYALLIIQAVGMMYFKGVFGHIIAVIVFIVMIAANLSFIKYLLKLLVEYFRKNIERGKESTLTQH